jgi:hypothetical protein
MNANLDVKRGVYMKIMKVHFSRNEEMISVLTNLTRDKPEGIVLMNLLVLKRCAAQTTLQAAIRSFCARSKYLSFLRKEVLQRRAASTIGSFFLRARILYRAHMIGETVRRCRSINKSNVFYVSEGFLKSVAKMSIKNPVPFGYDVDRKLSIGDESRSMFLHVVLGPSQKVVYAKDQLSSMVEVDVVALKASVSMFHDVSIGQKWLRRSKIVQLAFKTQKEATRRIALFGFLTEDFSSFMTEEDVLRFCAACSVQNCWRGFCLRRRYEHISTQKGHKIDFGLLLRRIKAVDKGQRMRKEEKDLVRMMPLSYMSTNDAIHQLRGDYRPPTAFKRAIYTPVEAEPIKDEEPVQNQSMRKLGLIDNIPSGMENPHISDQLSFSEAERKSGESQLVGLKRHFGYNLHEERLGYENEGMKENRAQRKDMPLESEDLESRSRGSLISFGHRGMRSQTNVMRKEVLTPALPNKGKRSKGTKCELANLTTETEEQTLSDLVKKAPQSTRKRSETRLVMAPRNAKKDKNHGVIIRPNLLTSDDMDAGKFSSFVAVDQSSEDAVDVPLRPKSSTQFIEKKGTIKDCVAKLTRLIWIFDQAQQETAVESSLEERIRLKHELINAQKDEANARKTAESLALQETRERIAIGRNEVMEKLEEGRRRGQAKRTAGARLLKSEHSKRMDKLQREKSLAQNFVNVSRKVAETCERRLRSQQGRREFSKVREAAEVARQADKVFKERYAREVRKIEDQKRNLAKYDQEKLAEQLVEEGRKRDERLEKYREWRREQKAIMKEVKEIRKKPMFVRNDPLPVVELDEVEGAVYVLPSYIGGNLGCIEARLLCEFLGMLT